MDTDSVRDHLLPEDSPPTSTNRSLQSSLEALRILWLTEKHIINHDLLRTNILLTGLKETTQTYHPLGAARVVVSPHPDLSDASRYRGTIRKG